MDAIGKALEHFGSQKALAAAIGMTQQGVSYCIRRGRVTAEVALRIEQATDGTVTAHQLRPDIFPKPEEAA